MSHCFKRIVLRGSALALSALALSVFALPGCVRRDNDASPAPSATPGVPAATPEQPALPTPPAVNVPTPGAAPVPAPKSDGTSTACTTDSDCRTYSETCGLCSCRPFAKTSPDPKCPGKPTTCLIDPCTGLRATCRKGNCTLGDPGDAALSDAPATSSKDAAVAIDAAGKSASSASPAASTPPKAVDAARH